MKDEQKDILNEYAKINKEIKELKKVADPLKDQVLEIMQESDLKEVEMDFGKIGISSKRKWTYTPDLTEKETELKLMKKEEEKLGTAEYTETFFTKLYFNE